MTAKSELLTQFEEWNHYAASIQDLDWNEPLEEGKWTIHDIVCHIMLWDKYFLEAAIDPITNETR